ncbi:hypothetical protein DMENIID0001_027430 [Sergentomyia squamirostris]
MKLFLSLSLFLWSFLVNCWTYPQNYVEEVFKWKSVTYENLPLSEYSWIGPYPYYIPENNDISSMAFHPASGLMIVNVLRIRPGIPSTLNAFCVNEYTVGSSPKLWGFPNYNVNTLRSSDFERQSDDHDDIDFRKYHKKPNKHGQNNYYHESHSHYGGSQDHHLVYQKPYYYTPKPTTTWSATKKPNYDLKRIISAYTTTVSEKCNRVYTIDTGVLDYNRSYTNILQKPAILIFDLQSDCCETRTFPLVRRSEYPDDIARSFPFGNIYFNLDYQSDDCDDLFIYISNPFTNTIIVYDYKRDDYWFFNNHPSFAPVIVESHMVFDKDFFYDLPIGIIHLALGYPDKYGDRTAYYIAGASTAQFSVSTAVLKDKSNAPSNYNVDDFKIMGYRGYNSYVGLYKYYIPEENQVSAVAFHPASGLMIVNVERIRPGVPSTLNAFCVNEYTVGSSPKIWGFPNYEVNALKSSDYYQVESFRYERESRHHKKSNKYGQSYNFHGSPNFNVGHHNLYHSYQKPYYISKPSPSDTTKKPHFDLKRIVSTYTTTISEKCNRAYTIDVGALILDYTVNSTKVIQKPAILVFDLQPDCCETCNFPLVRRSTFPVHIANNIPFGILWFTLDYQSDDCDDLFMYITNPYANTIIVYDYKRDDYWYFNHPSFAPVIAESHLVFDNNLFYDFPVRVVDVALGYADRYGDRTAYYFPGTSTAQFAVSTSVLKDKSNASTNYHSDDFNIMGYRGCDSQTVKMAVDYTFGVVFYLEMQSNRVRCWNMKKPLNPDNIGVVYESPEKLLYGISIFVDSRGYLWFSSCRLPIQFFTDDSLDLTKVNSSVFRVKVSKAIRGTACEDDEDQSRLSDILY